MTFPAPAAPRWFEIHDNLVILVQRLADNGYSAQDVADAVEKPWKYEDEYNQAIAALEADKA